MTSKDITLCGHGSGTPSLKNMQEYCASRYSQIASNGKRKGVVAVRRYKGLTDKNRQAFHDTYKTILGRNQYNQALRTYVYTPYHGAYYSDCSSSGCFTLRQIGIDCPDYNTAGIYQGNRFENVPVIISEGQIMNPEILQVGDALLFVGNDPARPLQIGHVEYVYEIKGDEKVNGINLKASVAAVAVRAQKEHWPYGDDHTNPPCPPIACDRGIFRALWDLSSDFRDQKAGGETVVTADAWFKKHSKYFDVITKQADVKPNDIILMKWTGAKEFHWKDHMFFCVAYNHSTGKCTKYDFGSEDRVKAGGYFVNVPFNEWTSGADKRTFYAAYRLKEIVDESQVYSFKPVRIISGASGKSQFAANRILKARGYKGTNADLQLNDKWTKGDVAALVEYKLERLRAGKNFCTGIMGDEITVALFEDMLGMTVPVQCVNVPAKCKEGNLILWLQEVLRSEDFAGKDGNPIELDGKWGTNTEYAVKQYQKLYGFTANGKVTYSVWKHMCTNRTPKAH